MSLFFLTITRRMNNNLNAFYEKVSDAQMHTYVDGNNFGIYTKRRVKQQY